MRRGEPKYLKLRRALLDLVSEESWEPGRQLPFDGALMERYRVSRNTVLQTIDGLEREGFVQRKQGKGTFYTGKKPEELGRSFLIGVVTLPDYFFPEIIKGIDDVARGKKSNIVLANILTPGASEVRLIESVIAKGVDGLLYNPGAAPIPEIRAWLKSITMPVVLLDWVIDDPEISYVSPDDFTGGRIAAEHLLRAGHRRIAFVGLRDHGPSQERADGCRAAMEAAGAAFDPGLVRWFSLHEDATAQARSLLALGAERPTGIIFYNDKEALCGYRAASEAGLRVPEDVSIIGYDDTDLARSAIPALTSVIHPRYNLGKWGAEILFDQIENPGARSAKHFTIQPSIAVRESVRRLG